MIVADILGIHPANQYRKSVFVVFLCVMGPAQKTTGTSGQTQSPIKWILIILSLASLSNFSSPFGATSAFPTIRHLYGVSEPSQRFKIILLTVA
ncbi:unnamed protein product [Brassica napus]|uniref:(rape) hypothetical protein n=1 Tax=Brassica napus TaxID=3708 RepID=A0A816KWN1_BRANA|nr:unnamed protein product [Brassica napus]